MTMNTYEKWMDFSTRLIEVLNVTDERKKQIRNEVTNFISGFEGKEIQGWDSITDDVDEYCGEYLIISEDGEIDGEFYNQISAVTRAGLDIVTEEFGGGVIGFTVGDLQDMYEDDIPDWVKNSIGIFDDDGRDEDIWL